MVAGLRVLPLCCTYISYHVATPCQLDHNVWHDASMIRNAAFRCKFPSPAPTSSCFADRPKGNPPASSRTKRVNLHELVMKMKMISPTSPSLFISFSRRCLSVLYDMTEAATWSPFYGRRRILCCCSLYYLQQIIKMLCIS